MRLALLVVLLAGCNNDLTPAGYAKFDGPERVSTSHVTTGVTSYGGGPIATWTVSLSTIDGCTPNGKVLDMELDILANGSTLPTGTPIPFRPVAGTVDTLPSAVLTYGTNTLTSGSMTLDDASAGVMSGNFTLQTSAGTFTGMFTGPVCPAN